jgi:hypothetical protein
MAYVKSIGAAICAAALIWAGWHVNGWRIGAAEASVARAELRAEMQRRIQSEDAGREIQAKLDAANAKINAKVKAYQTKVKANEANLECLVPEPLAGELSVLRAGQ